MKIDLKSVPTAVLLGEIEERCAVVKVVPFWAQPTLEMVANALSIPLTELLNDRSREAAAHWSRSIAITVLRTNTNRSYDQIGKIWSQSHGTMINAVNKVISRMEKDPDFDKLVSSMFL
jgi:chromosomal replication initiation ATPase DnaA